MKYPDYPNTSLSTFKMAEHYQKPTTLHTPPINPLLTNAEAHLFPLGLPWLAPKSRWVASALSGLKA